MNKSNMNIIAQISLLGVLVSIFTYVIPDQIGFITKTITFGIKIYVFLLSTVLIFINNRTIKLTIVGFLSTIAFTSLLFLVLQSEEENTNSNTIKSEYALLIAPFKGNSSIHNFIIGEIKDPLKTLGIETASLPELDTDYDASDFNRKRDSIINLKGMKKGIVISGSAKSDNTEPIECRFYLKGLHQTESRRMMITSNMKFYDKAVCISHIIQLLYSTIRSDDLSQINSVFNDAQNCTISDKTKAYNYALRAIAFDRLNNKSEVIRNLRLAKELDSENPIVLSNQIFLNEEFLTAYLSDTNMHINYISPIDDLDLWKDMNPKIPDLTENFQYSINDDQEHKINPSTNHVGNESKIELVSTNSIDTLQPNQKVNLEFYLKLKTLNKNDEYFAELIYTENIYSFKVVEDTKLIKSNSSYKNSSLEQEYTVVPFTIISGSNNFLDKNLTVPFGLKIYNKSNSGYTILNKKEITKITFKPSLAKTISGVIKDSNGNPIEKVKISPRRRGTPHLRGYHAVYSNEDGFWEMNRPAVDGFIINYHNLTKIITYNAEFYNICLNPETLEYCDKKNVIVGQVIDCTRKGLSDIKIAINNKKSDFRTDKNGFFSINSPIGTSLTFYCDRKKLGQSLQVLSPDSLIICLEVCESECGCSELNSSDILKYKIEPIFAQNGMYKFEYKSHDTTNIYDVYLMAYKSRYRKNSYIPITEGIEGKVGLNIKLDTINEITLTRSNNSSFRFNKDSRFYLETKKSDL